MEADDLMVGDWVYRPDCYDQVKEIRHTGVVGIDSMRGLIAFSELEPIPLTPEILEKNGFENGKLNFSPQYYLEYDNVFIGVTLKDIPDKHKGFDITKGKLFFQYDISYIEEPIYVHQLQHALRLCGITREIII